ncbi:MAG: hypothetical protein E5W82_09535 [Mesorhizobium sp.]|nr:MAG: hypothetical protein E5W82_09535 [Mesorhizobium sp.]
MKADNYLSQSIPSVSESKLYIGRFARRQGNYGTVAVVGRVGDAGIDVIEEPKRLFPRDGLVETHGVVHAGLAVGDWVEFDATKNQRPRGPEYKAVHLKRIPRYAILPDAEDATYRAMLTGEGWRGDKRAGLWALHISGGRVLVVELEAKKDGALGIARKSAREVRWWGYDERLVVRVPTDGESIYFPPADGAAGVFDWSNESDHVAQVIRSLSDANDPHIADLISWLEMHHEEQTGRVFAGAVDHDAAQASLRSGELAQRLRADRELMRAYLDAALHDDDVREAVAEWAREGHGAEADRLRTELEREIADKRTRLTEDLGKEIERNKKEALERVAAEVSALADLRRQALAAREREANDALEAKLKELDSRFGERKSELEREIARQGDALAAVRDATLAATGELELVKADTEEARSRLREASAEVDRLLAIAERLGAPAATAMPEAKAAAANGIRPLFPERPIVPAHDKGRAIAQNLLLTDNGKDQLRRLAVLTLAGEVPILTGSDAADFLQIAEAALCPGRFAVVDADPTLISLDDLWSRPGSGAPTLVAAAAAAASSGAVLVVIRDIERSGARFWLPTLRDTVRGGGLPRGLLVCCTVSARNHEEVAALPDDVPWIDAEGMLVEGAAFAAPMALDPAILDVAALDPGAAPKDFSGAAQIVPKLGFKPSVGQAMRAARIFAEARTLLNDDGEARRLAIALARSIFGQAG